MSGSVCMGFLIAITLFGLLDTSYRILLCKIYDDCPRNYIFGYDVKVHCDPMTGECFEEYIEKTL